VLDSLAPARRRAVLVGSVVLLVVAAVLAGVSVFKAARGDVQPVAQDELGPVLLVAGYGGSTHALEPLEAELESLGRTVLVVPPLDDATGDLEDQAEALGRFAQEAAASSGASSVDVVGYSAGGVVARLWVRDLGGDELARRVVGLGSPQHGTTVAEVVLGGAGGCPTACRQLVPDSDLMRRLNAGDETPEGPVFVAIYSTEDHVVTPPGSALLEGALGFSVQSVCPGDTAEHGDLPGDPVVLAALNSVLGTEPPAVPTDVACP
jgi:triacylglycerol lipase